MTAVLILAIIVQTGALALAHLLFEDVIARSDSPFLIWAIPASLAFLGLGWLVFQETVDGSDALLLLCVYPWPSILPLCIRTVMSLHPRK